MPREPRTLAELPAGVIRACFPRAGREHIVAIIDSHLPFARNDNVMGLTQYVDAAELAKRYWVISVRTLNFAFDEQTKKLDTRKVSKQEWQQARGAGVVKFVAVDTWQAAEQQYAAWASGDAEKTVLRGLRGLLAIGKNE